MIVEVNGQHAHGATGGVELDGDAPTVLLLHGAGMDATVWQLQTRYLAHHGLRPVAVDLPGHGRSEGPALESVEEMADWVELFSRSADVAPVNVVGHSMGTFIALELAKRYSSSVQSIVLLGTADAMPVHPDLLAAADDELDKAAALMASWSHAKPAHIGLNPTPGLWMLGGVRALVEASDKGVLATDFRACMAYQGALDAAATITCPVSVIVGKGDKMTPPKATAKVVAKLANPTVTELANVGHMMMLEDPKSVRRILIEALKT